MLHALVVQGGDCGAPYEGYAAATESMEALRVIMTKIPPFLSCFWWAAPTPNIPDIRKIDGQAAAKRKPGVAPFGGSGQQRTIPVAAQATSTVSSTYFPNKSKIISPVKLVK